MVTNNAINLRLSGIVKYDGAGTFAADTTTNHNVLIGALSNGINNAAPTATTGIPLISNGTGTDPSFSTAVVAGGGTGQVTLTNHGVLVGAGTTAITQLSVGANNSILMGSTGADPSFTTSGTPYATGISFDSGSHTLSTYSYGNFTPTVTSDGTPPTVSYSIQYGQYVKIGRMVSIAILLGFSSYVGGTGNIQVTSLPFNFSSAGNAVPPSPVPLLNNVTFTGSYVSGYGIGGSATMAFYAVSAAGTLTQLTTANLSSSSNIYLNFNYITDS